MALDAEETALLEAMMGRLDRLAEFASELRVKLMIDAEHTYFQPVRDELLQKCVINVDCGTGNRRCGIEAATAI